MLPVDQQFRAFLAEAETDPGIVGVILAGSRGKGAYTSSTSDYDAWVVVRDSASLDAYAARYPSRHGDPVEYILISLDRFRRYALPGEPSRWDAYTFAHVEPVIDKLDGEIARLVREKPVAPPDTAAVVLDGYINSYYRSAKNHVAGRRTEAHLDAAESIPWLLDFAFAAAGRVRPFNKWLLWELQHHPVDPRWDDGFVSLVLRVIATGDLTTQQTLFRKVESFALEEGLGEIVEGWEPDVAFLRGQP